MRWIVSLSQQELDSACPRSGVRAPTRSRPSGSAVPGKTPTPWAASQSWHVACLRAARPLTVQVPGSPALFHGAG